MPFDPYNLTASASLNRLRIVDLPGLWLPADVQGKTGYELASTAFVAGQVRQHGDDLDLSPAELAQDEHQLPLLLDRCFQSDNPQVKATAHSIAMKLGRNLAYLLLTLKRGDAVNRTAREDWDDSVWNYWRTIQLVRFGGGLVSGNLRQAINPGINLSFDTILGENIDNDMRITIAIGDYGGSLPLVGLARHAHHAIVLDFGGSFVKRGLSIYQHGKLVELRLMPSLPTQSREAGETAALFEFMVALIATTWHEAVAAGFSPASFIPVSFAAYIVNGQPAQRQGGMYAALRDLSDNVQAALSEAVSRRLDLPVQVRLFHDGTAAASVYAGESHSAVITLGTALGIGFPPSSDETLKALANPIKISRLR